MQISGDVEEVVYRNEGNGYSVVRVFTSSGLVVCVGEFPLVIEGESVIMNGDWAYNSKFGQQFSVTSAQIELPTTEKSMVKYLSSGLFKGVGEVLARRIVDKYKDKTFEVIECAPHMLSTIKAISYNKAVELANDFKEHKAIQSVIIYLQNYDISVNLAIKLYKVYGNNVQIKLESNPYQLIKDVDGIGFLIADRIAQKIGVAKDSKFRIYAAISYVLTEAANKNGHTYLMYDEVVNNVSQLIKIEEDGIDLIKTCIRDCEDNNEIRISDEECGKIVMSTLFYNTEKSIAKKLISLMNEQSYNISLDLDADIKTYQDINNIELDIKQIEAIKSCLTYGVNVITGGPGTGKTTIIKAIIQLLNNIKTTFALCAPTGRAAKRLTESTGYEAKTIHRLLGLNFNTGSAKFQFDSDQRLPVDVIIVDEVSMCDVFIFNSLIVALKKGARLILLGDKDQLPSVGAGNVLSDIINSKVIPINYLTHIFRQSENSMIVYNANEINNGNMPKLNNESDDFFFNEAQDPNVILNTTIELASKRIPKHFKIRSDDIQILCPMKKGIAGVENINIEMQKVLNPKIQGTPEIIIGNSIFRINDKIIHVENNYQMEWKSDNDLSSGTGVFNGDMGYIIDIDPHKPSLTVRFDDGKVAVYTQAEFSQISLAYAISIHKSQGSEFNVVIIAISGSSPLIMTRNLIYTAITRAKKLVVIVGSKQILGRMIANNNILKRNSKLLEFLREEATFSLNFD